MIKVTLLFRGYFSNLALITRICFQENIKILKIKRSYMYNNNFKATLIVNSNDELKTILRKFNDYSPDDIAILKIKEIKKDGIR